MKNRFIISFGESRSLLSFLKMGDWFEVYILEISDKITGEKVGFFYSNPNDADGVSTIIGYGLTKNFIGKNLGEDFLIEILAFLKTYKQTKAISGTNMSRNKFSKALWTRLKLREDLIIDDDGYVSIMKFKN